MKFSKKAELIILFFVIFVFINFLYYTYVYSYFQKKKNRLVNKISSVNSDITNQILQYQNSMKIFDKIKFIKSEIRKTEDSLILLKTKVKTDVQVSEIIKSLIKESGIKLHNLTLKGKEGEGKSLIYKFDAVVSGNLENLVRLLDKIDNKNELLKINSYNVKKNDESYSMNIIISSIYQRLSE